MKQTYTSAGTSLKQVPAVFKLITKAMDRPEVFWAYTNNILDYGGGKYDLLTEKLAEMRIRNLILDPYNRSDDHNKLVRQLLEAAPADHAICSNVLNVIKEPAVRQEVLREIADLTSSSGYVFITVYEGDRSSRGRKTSKGWQANRPLRSYEREIKKVFAFTDYAKGVSNMLICSGRK